MHKVLQTKIVTRNLYQNFQIQEIVRMSIREIFIETKRISCTPIIGSYPDDVGMCIPSMESCDLWIMIPDYAIKFSVSLTHPK